MKKILWNKDLVKKKHNRFVSSFVLEQKRLGRSQFCQYLQLTTLMLNLRSPLISHQTAAS